VAKELILDVVAKKTSRDLGLLADEFEKLAGQTDDFGNKLNKTTTFSKLLDTQIAKTKTTVKELGQELDRTGSKDTAGLLKGAQANLKSLERIKGDLSKALEDGGKDAAPVVFDGIIGTLKNLPPEFQGFLVGGAVLAAPVVGSAIGGAILAGVGAAGIGLAIAGQIHNPAVVSAFADLKTEVTRDLTAASSAFGPVLVDTADKAGAAFARITPGLERALDKLAPKADHLVDGFTGLAENAAPGFTKALQGSGVVIDQLAKDLPKLGSAVGTGLGLIADNAQGAADGLHQVLNVAGALILTTSGLVNQLEQADIVLEKLTAGHLTDLIIGPGLAKALDGNADSANNFNSIVGKLAFGFLDYAGKGDKAKDSSDGFAQKLTDLRTALEKTTGAQNDLTTATIAWNTAASDGKLNALQYRDATDNLKTALQNSKGAFTDNTAAGRANEEAYLAAAGAAQQHATKVYESTGSALAAAQAYRADKTALDAAAASGGATAAQIAKLNTQLDNAVKIRKGSVTIEVSLTGNGKGLVLGNQGTYLNASNGVKYRAAGGPILPGQPYVVGERGPELIVPNTAGTVIPKVPTAPSYASVGRDSSGGAASAPRAVQHTVTFSGATDSVFASAFMELVRNGLVQIQTVS